MQNFLDKQSSQSGFKKVSPYDIPQYYRNHYFDCLNHFIDYYKKMIFDILNRAGRNLKFPIEYKYLENYLDGFEFVYIGFNKSNSGIDGLEGFYQFENGTVYVFYNQESSQERIRFTITHELFHFCQSVDPYFKTVFDYIINNYQLHQDVIYTLLEKATDKATAIYLMPSKHFYKKFQETKDIYEVSRYFKVSVETASYRLKECQQFI